MHGRMPGDPRRAAEAIVSLEQLASPPLRLLLGKPVLDMMRGKLREMEQTLGEWESVTLGADYPADLRQPRVSHAAARAASRSTRSAGESTPRCSQAPAGRRTARGRRRPAMP